MGYLVNEGAFTASTRQAALLNPLTGTNLIIVAGAIDPHTAGRYMITAGSALALTLGAPTVGTEDGLTITIYSSTAFAHTVTATGLYQDGAGHANLATFSANAGAQIVLIAFNGKWIADGNGVTYS